MSISNEVLDKITYASKTNATALDLRNSNLTELPENISQLSNLTSIDISNNSLTELPESIIQLTNLKIINLNNNNLRYIPKSLTSLANLTRLDLIDNNLTDIPESIAHLSSVTHLDLSGNHLTQLPENISELSNIVYMGLNGNGLMLLPKGMTQLKQCTHLDLRNNSLTELPNNISKLAKLACLYLSNNKLITLPKSIGQLTQLTYLDLSNNNIAELPDVITKLPRLEYLYLKKCNITKLTEKIAELKQLAYLDLRENGLTQLPEAITHLSKLFHLDIRNCDLTELPEAISQLTSLAHLQFSGNRLVGLPKSLTLLTDLTYLDLRNANLSIPPEIIDDPRNTSQILAYLRQLNQTPIANRPMDEAKIILVGEAQTGKTSIVNRLIKNTFNTHEPKTDGVDIHRWNLQAVKYTNYNGVLDDTPRTVRLNVWDLGGQEIYHATHQFFLTERTLYLLVVSARLTDEQNRLHYWLKTIRALGKDAPILIIHNQHETNPEQLDRKTLRGKYPTICNDGFIETSCPYDTLKGIEELKNKIKREIGKMRHVTDPLPGSYFDVKERLEKETKNRDFITGEEYEDICSQAGVSDLVDQSNILRFLHALGTVVSFQEDLRLRDTNVLNPEWVTEGVYSVLDDPVLKKAGDGILRAKDMTRILKKASKDYPAEKHSYILDMMVKFELCFERTSQHSEYLIPELLSPIEPDDIGQFENALQFELQYEFLPRSIIPRFIVRTSHLHQPYYWRNGLVIKKEDNQARIRADMESNKITISVIGNENTRRDLLSVLRDHFDQIHIVAETLAVKEQIPFTDYPKATSVPYRFLRELEDKHRDEFYWPDVHKTLSVVQLLSGIERIRRPTIDNLEEMSTNLSTTPPSYALVNRHEQLQQTGLITIGADNHRFLNELIDKVEKDRVVPFIGAGLTIPLGMPGWVSALDTVFEAAKPNLSIDDAVRYATAKAANKWEEAAQSLWDANGLGARWFNDQIKALFGKNKIQFLTGAITLLPKFARGPVLTTNFDGCLERVYSDAGQGFSSEQTVLGDYRADNVINSWDEGDRFLLKLHGDADESSGRVLTYKQYERAYSEDSKLPELLNALFGSRRPLLFLGCSLLTDRTLIELEKAGLRQTNAYHFALLELPETEDERKKRQNELIARYGIQPIWFAKGDFAAIERVLQFLVDVRAAVP